MRNRTYVKTSHKLKRYPPKHQLQKTKVFIKFVPKMDLEVAPED
jgi:hypothetical protein